MGDVVASGQPRTAGPRPGGPSAGPGLLAGPWAVAGRPEALASILGALTGEAGHIVVCGPTGAGKTALARTALARVEDLGHPTGWWPVMTAGTEPSLSGQPSAGRPLPSVLASPESGNRAVVVVDDAHRLDPEGILSLQRAAASGAVGLLVTVGSGGAVPPGIASLWRSGLAHRLDLGPLTEPAAAELVEAALEGAASFGAVRVLWSRSGGNLRWLRYLIDDGVTRGWLRRDSTFWWADRPSGSPGRRLAALLEERLGGLGPPQRMALEMVALARSVPLAVAGAAVPGEVLEELEAAGLLEVTMSETLATSATSDRSDRPAAVRLAGPLDGDWLLGRMPLDRTQQEAARLSSVVLSMPGAREVDGVAAARWRLMAGLPMTADESLAAAELAVERFDLDSAEPLVRMAVELGAAGAGPLQDEVLAAREGRVPGHTEGTVRGHRGTARGDLWTTGIVDRAGCREGGSPAHPVRGPTARRVVREEIWEAALGGELDAAVERAGSEIDRGAGGDPRPLTIPYVLALGWGGWVVAARRAADDLLGRAVEREDDLLAATASTAVGLSHLAAGQPGRARRPLEEAVAGLRRQGPRWLLPLATAELVRAYALVGDADTARRVLRQIDPAATGAALFVPVVSRARAWVAAGEGRVEPALSEMAAAARSAADRGQATVEVLALHDQVRLGQPGPVVDRLRQLAEELPNAAFGRLARHAEALREGSVGKLETAARHFEDSGEELLAAETWAQAAEAARRAGDDGRSRRSSARSGHQAARCGHPRPITITGPSNPPALTERETQVARLAQQGMSTRQIAAVCALSERTVENHLQRTYGKLGITGRHQLASVLGHRPPSWSEARRSSGEGGR